MNSCYLAGCPFASSITGRCDDLQCIAHPIHNEGVKGKASEYLRKRAVMLGLLRGINDSETRLLASHVVDKLDMVVGKGRRQP